MAIKTWLTGWAVLLLTAGCTGVRHIAQADGQFVPLIAEAVPAERADVTAMIAPYKAQLEDQMNEVIADVGVELVKERPEGTLGNWVTDALMAHLQRSGTEADMAIFNYGGLRVPAIQPGPLTVGEIFELSPFDNILIVMDIPGIVLDSLLQHIAGTGGWPMSRGTRMVISRGKLSGFALHGEPIDKGRTYRVAMPDYVAQGGDGSKMLTSLPHTITGTLVRDILIREARITAADGRPITAVKEGRTVNEYP